MSQFVLALNGALRTIGGVHCWQVMRFACSLELFGRSLLSVATEGGPEAYIHVIPQLAPYSQELLSICVGMHSATSGTRLVATSDPNPSPICSR